MKPITLVGSGESLHFCDWESFPGDVGVLSGAINFFQYKHVDHFFAVDGPSYFPDWVSSSTRFSKHVLEAPFWKELPNCVFHECDGLDHGVNLSGTGKICNGPLLDRRHTLLFAVQVLPRLGYDRVTFVGVDLISTHQIINDIMRKWHPLATKNEIEWFNASPLSAMQAWMPSAQEMIQI